MHACLGGVYLNMPTKLAIFNYFIDLIFEEPYYVIQNFCTFIIDLELLNNMSKLKHIHH